MVKKLMRAVLDEEGVSTVETALLLVLVSIVGFCAYQELGRITGGFAGRAGSCFSDRQSTGGG